ncbi:aspartate kinase [Sarracenia purpurea var. burkii]
MLDIVSTHMLAQFGFLAKELDHVVEELEKIAVVNLIQHRSIISLIGNVQRSSLILEKVSHLLVGIAQDHYPVSLSQGILYYIVHFLCTEKQQAK